MHLLSQVHRNLKEFAVILPPLRESRWVRKASPCGLLSLRPKPNPTSRFWTTLTLGCGPTCLPRPFLVDMSLVRHLSHKLPQACRPGDPEWFPPKGMFCTIQIPLTSPSASRRLNPILQCPRTTMLLSWNMFVPSAISYMHTLNLTEMCQEWSRTHVTLLVPKGTQKRRPIASN